MSRIPGDRQGGHAAAQRSIALCAVLLLFLLPGVAFSSSDAPSDSDDDTAATDEPAKPDPTLTSEGKPKKPTPSLQTEPDLPGGLRDLEEHFGVLTEGAQVHLVQTVSSRLLAGVDEDQAAMIKSFRVLDSEIENAFAVPDGHIYVFRGLLDRLETPDQLAGVLGHEMTHVFRKHNEMVNQD
ncbi:MAG: M48 family metallopeptidase, partial [bacterium]